eukprot:CAMPEP_0168610690 /NCGR_PEP_ID=MMETSP0449_2-20121227/1925_1 /TAXON_ID=1082188 /ORGANISM="Strombidium rassoulzadegani, Strain ras09" /LENGTH=284 /DNA_ID=CAMNT_0008651019 /DNA_START=758 /DNA_END=1611 /DNA_ORIENTATION=+
MHILYQIYHLFESVEFQVSKKPAGFLSTWFDFPKSIRNNILVELNINSLSEVYALDAQAQKETIGSLNWKKFAERIQTQLAENQSLTKNQRRTMKINSIISLIKSNSFDEANKQLLACMKADEFRGEEKLMATLRNIQIYLQVKDKKYAEALAILEKNSKVASLTLAEVFHEDPAAPVLEGLLQRAKGSDRAPTQSKGPVEGEVHGHPAHPQARQQLDSAVGQLEGRVEDLGGHGYPVREPAARGTNQGLPGVSGEADRPEVRGVASLDEHEGAGLQDHREVQF